MNNNTPQQHLQDFLRHTAPIGRFAVVLGRPIAQSLSPLIHNAAFRHHHLPAEYYPVLVREEDENSISALISHPNFIGANVTSPLKQKVLRFLDVTSDLVAQTGACNTIFKDSNGQICGENTDVSGFQAPLFRFQSELKGKDAIIFGTGGASKAVIKAFRDLDVRRIYAVSRNPHGVDEIGIEPVGYSDWRDLVSETAILVNASPIGMYPNVNDSPVLSGQVAALRGKICYDLIYRPLRTRFLEQAAGAGASCIDGVPMFIGQAAAAFQLFTGKEFPVEKADQLVREKLMEATEG